MFYRLIWTKLFYYILASRFYLSLSVILTPHLLNVAEFRQLQKPNAQTKYFEILSAHPETPCNTTQKLQIDILNLDATFLITFERECMHGILIFGNIIIPESISNDN